MSTLCVSLFPSFLTKHKRCLYCWSFKCRRGLCVPLFSLYIYHSAHGASVMLICTKTPALSNAAMQSVCEMCLTICLVLLSRWFPGSRICPLIRSRWRRELWCPRAQQGLTTYSPGCCHTLLGIQGWLLNLRCLVTYHHMLPRLDRHGRKGNTIFYYFTHWFYSLTSWDSWDVLHYSFYAILKNKTDKILIVLFAISHAH